MSKRSESNKKKQTFVIVSFCVILVMCALVVWASFEPMALEGVKEITVNIVHSDFSYRKEVIRTNVKTLAEAVEELELFEYEETPDGPVIVGADGELIDLTEGYRWVFTVNGDDATKTMEEQRIKDGDTYKFTITQDEPEDGDVQGDEEYVYY